MRSLTDGDGYGGSMGLGSRVGRIAGTVAVALTGVAVAAPAASADFHLMKIREVAVNVAPQNAYIELQMYAPGQTNVGTHVVSFWTATGTLSSNFTIPGSVANGENQRTILIGDTGVPNRDFAYDVLYDAVSSLGPGGAACFDGIDCVSWGTFSNPGALSSPPGSPAPPIPNGSSLERSIAPNCSTLLEDADDTNNSAADLFLTTPSPRNNATPPTETPCTGGGPDTRIDKAPKKKTKKKKATFEFSSPSAGATFECELDGGKAFTPCTSPFRTKVKKGKHTFKVRAVLGGVPDGSPAGYKWKVKKKKKR
jgi:hypothetical protein